MSMPSKPHGKIRVNNSQDASINDRVKQTHAWREREGFRPVRLHHQKKAAVDPSYASKNPSINEFKPGEGIGVVTGLDHDGPIDVDLDSKLATVLAPSFFPKTPAVFGHKSKPRSHLLYKTKTSPHPRITFTDPILSAGSSTLLELRGDGGLQTVLPGSLHEDTGELVEWEDGEFPPVPEIEYEALLLAAKKTAAAELLIKHVWHEGLRNDSLKFVSGMLCHFDWTVEDAKHFIDVVMDHAHDDPKDRHSRIKTIEATFRKYNADDKVAGGPSLTKLLGDSRITDRLYEWFAPRDFDPRLSTMLEDNDIVKVKGKTVILGWRKQRLFEGPHGMHEVPEMSSARDYHLYHADKTTTGDKGKPVPLSYLFIKRAKRYEDLVLEPGRGPVIDGCLNLWRGFGVKPKVGNWSLMEIHMQEVVAGGDEALFQYLKRWMAWTVQNPGLPAGVAIVMQGKEGTGKGMFVNALCRIFGPHGLQISDPRHPVGHFNLHLAQCVLLFVDEGFWAGDTKSAGTLKRVITEPTLFIEPKNVNPFQVRNCLHILIASNNDWVIPAGMNARRFAATNVSGHRMGDRAYFQALSKEIESGGLEAMLKDLLERDLQGWHPRDDVPQTKALLDQKERTLRGVDSLVVRLAHEGQLPFTVEEKPNVTTTTGEEYHCGFWYYIRMTLPDLRWQSRQSTMKDLCEKYGCRRYKNGNKRGIAFPPLSELRAIVDRELGPQEWDDTGEWIVGSDAGEDDGTKY